MLHRIGCKLEVILRHLSKASNFAKKESKAFQSKALFMVMEYAIPYLGNMLDQVLWFIDDGFHFFPSKARVQ
jgi:hypothetical protein